MALVLADLGLGARAEDAGKMARVAERLVLVVDAHELVGSSLAIALRHAGFRARAMDPDGLDLRDRSGEVQLAAGDIVLVGLLYGDGRTAVPLIRPLAQLGCRVLVMTSDQGLPLIGECLEGGAEAVLDKGMSFDRLVVVLRRLSNGGCGMTTGERAALLEAVERHETAECVLHRPFERLTDREAEILTALITGAAPKQIAKARGIALSTVRGHIQGALAKLKVGSQREALALARHAGWPVQDCSIMHHSAGGTPLAAETARSGQL